MADEQPVIDPIDPLVDPPLRTEAPADFTPKADRFLAALPAMVRQFNAAIAKMNSLATWVMNVAKAAAASATASDASAKASATSAQQSSGFADASKGSADAASNTLTSVRAVAQAVDQSAGLPPGVVPGAVLRQKLDGSGLKEWWVAVLSQIGDTIVSTQAPDAGWIPTGRIYAQNLYPQLAVKLGAIADWAPAAQSLASSTTSYNMTCVASGNGYTVALGGSSSFVSTDYMASYAVYSAYSNYTWSNIDFGFGRFIAVSENAGGAYHSTTGQGNWAIGTGTPSGGTITRLRVGATVALWLQQNITAYATSTDGINWTQRTLPFTPYGIRPAFGKGLFVAISSTSIIWTSPDAINWTNRGAMPGVTSLNVRVESSDTGFLLLETTTGNCAYSPDGIVWTAATKCPASTTSVSLSGGPGGFIVHSANMSTYLTTVDGSKWISRNLGLTSLQAGQGGFVYIAAIKSHLLVPSPTNSNILRLKPYSYDSAGQFYTTDPMPVAQGLNQYIRGA